MAWVYLLTAGALEVAATTVFRYTEGLSRIVPTVTFFAIGIASFYFLNRSLAGVPLGTAYAVWTGIGAAGTAALGILAYGEGAATRPHRVDRRAHRLHRRPQVRLRALGTSDDQLLSPRDRLRARPLHRRPERRQARRRDRAAQSLAAPAARRRAERGGAAQEHPDDRPDGRRQDGDLAPAGEARRRSLHQGGGDQVHRGGLRRTRRR